GTSRRVSAESRSYASWGLSCSSACAHASAPDCGGASVFLESGAAHAATPTMLTMSSRFTVAPLRSLRRPCSRSPRCTRLQGRIPALRAGTGRLRSLRSLGAVPVPVLGGADLTLTHVLREVEVVRHAQRPQVVHVVGVEKVLERERAVAAVAPVGAPRVA